MGEAADTVVAFNEQVLYSRIDVGALAPGATVLLESKWAEDPDPAVRKAYADALEASGVPVSYRNYQGLIHGFANMTGLMPAARAAYYDLVERFCALLHP